LYLFHADFLLGSTLKMETCSSETSVTFKGLHGVIFQKVELRDRYENRSLIALSAYSPNVVSVTKAGIQAAP
jgi:hypothetical protein